MEFSDINPGSLRLTPNVTADTASGALRAHLPLPLPPGVPEGAPDLALAYGSSSASSIVGAGWSLSLPAAIKVGPIRGVPSWSTDDGYQFGAEELLPWVMPDGSLRTGVQGDIAQQTWRLATKPDDLRVEQRTNTSTGLVTWLTRDGGNVLTLYGEDDTARIFDPESPSRIAAWLPTFRVDPVGRAIVFDYVEEDLRGVDCAAASERGRLRSSQPQRYIKTIRFGNREPAGPEGPAPGTTWNFVLVFDYGDHDPDAPGIAPDWDWAVRPDPSSSFRLGFDLRTWRRCEAIHVFQRIGDGYERVSTTRFIYAAPSTTVISRLVEVQHSAWRDAGTRSASLPPIRFRYAEPSIDPHIGSRVRVPASRQGLANTRTRWVDLHGDGLPGVLTEASAGWWYSRNLGGGRFAAPTALAERPSTRLNAMALGDEDQDGNTDLATLVGRGAGRYQLDRDLQAWSGYQARSRTAHVEGIAPRVQRVDLDGDGRPDLVVSEADHFLWYPSDAPDGLGEPRRIPKPSRMGPARELRPDPALDLLFADMSGDGLPDLVRVENGRVEYWPNLGNGRFGDAVVVDDAPSFSRRDAFDIRRLRLADLTGNGCPDLLYLDGKELRWWYNLGGNRLRFGGVRRGVPSLDGLTDLRVLEIYGDGRPALVWSSMAPTSQGLAALPLTGQVKPGRLVEIDDGSGLSVRVHWSTSGQHMLRDLMEGTTWSTHLPQHVSVVDRIEVEERMARTLATTTFRYHDGHMDSEAREFRGFGCVDQLDVEVTTDDPLAPTSVPRLTRSWQIVGAPDEMRAICNRGWDEGPLIGAPRVIGLDSPIVDRVRARRAVSRRPRRVEVYAAPGNTPDPVPLEVHTWTWEVQAVGGDAPADAHPIRVIEREQVHAVHEGEASDPRINRALTVLVDDTGHPILLASVAHARLGPEAPGQDTGGIELHETRVVHVDTEERFERAIPFEVRRLELFGVDPSTVTLGRLLADDVNDALVAPMAHHEQDPGVVAARLWNWERSFYYDDARADELPLGQVGTRTFVHHESAAVFDAAWPAAVYDGRVDDARLLAEGYRGEEGYWWRDDPVHVWGTDAEFAPLIATLRPDGTGAQLEYSDQVLVASTDAVGNRTEAELDPYVRAPWRITDANGLVQEVEYDPFGIVVRQVRYGTVTDAGVEHPWGGEALTPVPSLTLDAALADPQVALGACNSATWIDLDAPKRDDLPARMLTVERTGLLHDGAGGGVDPEVRVQLVYLDGSGEVLQTRLRVESGDAVQRAPDGSIVVDAGGVPVLGPTADRWLVSGFEVKNRKQEVVRVHEPFFSVGAAFEADEALLRLGVSTAFTYDAMGRVARVDHPDGSFEGVEHTAWSAHQLDRNDTAVDSIWGATRSLHPVGSPERVALERVSDHANTPTIVELDPWGREVQVTSSGAATADDRVVRTVYDGGGRPIQIIDARGLIASHEELGLDGETVYQHSIDAGETWQLSDAFGRPRHRWDGLGHHVETTFDAADRPLHEHVRGGGLDHHVSAFIYGESIPDGDVRNARGRLVETRDGAGRHEVLRYDPVGAPLESERQLREELTGEPDWRLAVPLSAEHFTSQAVYDAVGRIVQATLPDGLLREVAWTITDSMRSVALTAPDGTLLRTEVFADAEQDAGGRRVSRSLGNGVVQDWSYEIDTRRLSRQRARLGGNTIQDLRTSYDPMGNVLRVVDLVQEPGFPGALLHGLNTSAASVYRYDPHYRLIEAKGRVHRALLPSDNLPSSGSFRSSRRVSLNDGSQVERYTRTYQYDPADNLLQMHHQGVTASWTRQMWVSASSNRSLPERDLADIPITDPEARFDAAGQLVEMDHLRRVEWSWRGTLSRAVLIDRSASGGVDDAEHYAYGADRMRVRKVLHRLSHGDIETTETIYLDGCEIRRVRQGNQTILERWTSHVHDEHGRVALVHRWTRDDLARETDDLTQARVHYILGNIQDSAVMELDEAGGLIAYEEYFPYGGTSYIAGNDERAISLRNYRHMGKERDAATGLSYFGHRYHAPWAFRWVSPDPAGMVDGPNLFAFTRGNPSTLIDKTGLDSSKNDSAFTPLFTFPSDWSKDKIIDVFNRTLGKEIGVTLIDIEQKNGIWVPKEYVGNNLENALAQYQERQELQALEPYQSALGESVFLGPSSIYTGDPTNGTGTEGSTTSGSGVGNTAGSNGNKSGAGGNTPGKNKPNGEGTTPGGQGTTPGGEGKPGGKGTTPGGDGKPGGKGTTPGGDGKPGGASTSWFAALFSSLGAVSSWLGALSSWLGKDSSTDGVAGGENGTRLTGPLDGVAGGTGDVPGTGPSGLDPTGNVKAPPASGPTSDGSPHGNPGTAGGGSPSGGSGSTGTENGQEPRTWFDDVVTAAGYLNFESGEDSEDGDRYGIPGGMGWLPGSREIQLLYVALSVINFVLLFTGIGEIGLALKASFAALRRMGLKGALRSLSKILSSRAKSLPSGARRKPTEWLNWFGDKGGYTSIIKQTNKSRWWPKFQTVIKIDDMPGTWAFRDTAAHEKFHAFLAKHAGIIWKVGDARLGKIPIGAPVKYLEEVGAYTIGHTAALRFHAIPTVPIEAFESLTRSESLFTIFSGSVGAAAYSGLRD